MSYTHSKGRMAPLFAGAGSLAHLSLGRRLQARNVQRAIRLPRSRSARYLATLATWLVDLGGVLENGPAGPTARFESRAITIRSDP